MAINSSDLLRSQACQSMGILLVTESHFIFWLIVALSGVAGIMLIIPIGGAIVLSGWQAAGLVQPAV